MAQIATSFRPRFFQVNRLVLVLLLSCGVAFAATAQRQPYLLLQGPSVKKTYRFMIGQVLTLRLQGEEEFFQARLNALYPESQTLRIDDMILSMEKIAEFRHEKRSARLKRNLQVQGGINLALIGGFSAFPSQDRDRQKNFLIGAAVASAVMVIFGSIGRVATRTVGGDSAFLLKVAGGDIREGDDGDLR